MEELRSSETLDKEILEDARKKAVKILKNADDTVRTVKERWKTKTEEELQRIAESYRDKEEKTRESILARLPLDMRRIRSEVNEKHIQNAMRSFLKSLSAGDLLTILENEFAMRLKACKREILENKHQPVLFYSGMSEAEIKKFDDKLVARPDMAEIFGNICDWELRENKTPEFVETREDAVFPALIFDTPEFRISASIESAAARLLDRNRAEIVRALLGQEALNE